MEKARSRIIWAQRANRLRGHCPANEEYSHPKDSLALNCGAVLFSLLSDNDKMNIRWEPLGTFAHFPFAEMLCSLWYTSLRQCTKYGRWSHMNVEELKARLRVLLHQRDMFRFEHASLERLDLMKEVETEIQEL